MLSTLSLTSLGASVLLFSQGIQATDDSFVRFPVQAHAVHNSLFAKRQVSVSIRNGDTGTIYLITPSIGTPAQPVSVLLDTGSVELWVNPVCSTSADPVFCETLGQFNPLSSSSSESTGQAFNITYGKGDVQGELYNDNLVCGSATITGQKFGVAKTSSFNYFGIMGVGPHAPNVEYPTVIEQMVNQGKIQSEAFSLDLRSVDTAEGSIIFGGVDSKKYGCDLQKFDIIPAAESPDNWPRYWVYLSSIGQSLPGHPTKSYPSADLAPANSNGRPVMLDSGTTVAYLPSAIVKDIAADFPGIAAWDATQGYYTVPCSSKSLSGSIDFSFDEKTIKVPYNEFVWQRNSTNCVLGMAADDSMGYTILGDAFLRAAYVVFDLANQNIWLDQAADCGSNVVPIGKGSSSVPQEKGCSCPVAPSPSTPSSTKAPTSKASSTPVKTYLVSVSTHSVKPKSKPVGGSYPSYSSGSPSSASSYDTTLAGGMGSEYPTSAPAGYFSVAAASYSTSSLAPYNTAAQASTSSCTEEIESATPTSTPAPYTTQAPVSTAFTSCTEESENASPISTPIAYSSAAPVYGSSSVITICATVSYTVSEYVATSVATEFSTIYPISAPSSIATSALPVYSSATGYSAPFYPIGTGYPPAGSGYSTGTGLPQTPTSLLSPLYTGAANMMGVNVAVVAGALIAGAML